MSFKLAVFSDEVSQDLSRAIAVAGDYHLDGLEIRSVWDKGSDELDAEDARRIKSEMGEAGLEVCALSTRFLKCDLGDEAALREHLDILRRCIDTAGILDTTILRIFTFWRQPEPESRWDEIVDIYHKHVIPMVESSPVMLAIENEASTIIGSGDELHRFLQKVDHPKVRGLWDPCNVLFMGEGHTIYPDDYQACKDDIIHVHVKDARWNKEANEAECVLLGDGEIGIGDQLAGLAKDGYDEWLSLETHWRPTKLSETELNLPGGANFSKEGEYASRKCLDSLAVMLNERGLA